MKVIHSPHHSKHATTLQIPGCPLPCFEIPARAVAILEAIRNKGVDELSEPNDYGLDPICKVHAPDFVRYLQEAYQKSRPFFEGTKPAIADTYCSRTARHKPEDWPGKLGYYSFDATAPILGGTWEAAYWSAQCAVTAADIVRSGTKVAYALCRPPGHHATSDQHGGFCYLNNAAIATARLQQETGERVAILDIDYHHGNGTQEIFYKEPNVLFCSIHAHPDIDYPFFWGGPEEKGDGSGAGYNYNWPLPHRATESQFIAALSEAIAAIHQFKPKFLVLSAGFDFMESDPAPLGGGAFQINANALDTISKMISEIDLPTVIIQEGGYAIDRLGSFVVQLLSAFNHRD